MCIDKYIQKFKANNDNSNNNNKNNDNNTYIYIYIYITDVHWTNITQITNYLNLIGLCAKTTLRNAKQFH